MTTKDIRAARERLEGVRGRVAALVAALKRKLGVPEPKPKPEPKLVQSINVSHCVCGVCKQTVRMVLEPHHLGDFKCGASGMTPESSCDLVSVVRHQDGSVREPEISINGVPLTDAQAMAVRVAVSAMRIDLRGQDLRTRVGDALAEKYDARLSEVERIMVS